MPSQDADGNWIDDDGRPVPVQPQAAAAPMPYPAVPVTQPVIVGSGFTQPSASPAPVQPAPLPSPVVPGAKLEKTSTSTTSVHAAKEEKAAAQKYQAEGAKVVKAIEGQADHKEGDRIAGEQLKVDQAQAAATLGAARQEEALAKQREADRASLQTQQDAAVSIARKASDDEFKKYQGMKISDFYDDATEGQKARMLLGIAISGIGNAIAGGKQGNMAEQTLDTMIAHNYQVQKANIDKQYQTFQGSRVGLEDAEKGRERAYLDLDHKFAGLYGAIAKEAATKKAQTGADEATIARDRTVNKYATEAEQKRVEASEKAAQFAAGEVARTEGLRSHSTSSQTLVDPSLAKGGAAKELTGPQAEAAAAVGMLSANLEQLGKLPMIGPKALERVQENRLAMEAAQAKGIVSGVAGIAGRKMGIVPRSEMEGLLPAQKQAYLLWQDVRAQRLKAMTGAGMSASEMADADQRYSVQPSDDAATIRAKFEGSKRFAQEMLIKTGQASAGLQQRISALPTGPGSTMPKAPSAAPSTGGMPPGAVAGTKGGKRGYSLNGLFYVTEMAQK